MRQFRTLFADIFFILLIILLVIFSFISYKRLAKAGSANNFVNHTNQVKLTLEKVMSSINDAETAQRGFLLTKDSAFLMPYIGSELRTDKLVSILDSFTRDSKQQQANIGKLKRLISLRYDRLRFNLERKDESLSEAYPYLADGNRYMTQIRNKITEMTRIEEALLLRRTEDRNRYEAITPLYTLLFSIFAISIVTIVYFRLRNETQLRIRAQDSEAAIHNFFMQVPAMVAILKGVNHRFEFANPAYLELVGQRDIVGKEVREALPEVSTQGYLPLLDKVFTTGETYTGKEMEFQLKDANGEFRSAHINFTYQAIVGFKGKIQGILVFCYNVSEMVATRKKIEETEQRLRLAIEAADIGTFDWNFVNKTFISSKRLTQIFGFADPEGITHIDLLETFHPDDKPKRDKAVEESYAKGSLVYEARVIWPDGSIRWVNVYGKIIYNENRERLRMYGTALDITTQKTILEEIRESENRFRLLANSMPQQIWTGDEKGNLNYFNDAVFKFSGLTALQLQNGGWLEIVHPDDRAENMKKWVHSVETGQEFFMEHRFKNYHGEYRWQLSRALPQKDSQDKIQRWVGTSTDIQEQRDFMDELEKQVSERTKSLKEANSTLENTVLELERINGELESFNYIASHDLQEPLRKIIAFSQRIKDREIENLTEVSRDYFSRITGAAIRMQHLIDAFLSYSQTTDSHSNFQEVDLNELLTEVKNDLSNAIEEKEAVIISAVLPRVKVIRIQFHQLFANLISNSIKYSKVNAAPRIRISVSEVMGSASLVPGMDASVTYLKISFTDNGIGFEQQYVNKIFQLFQRLHGKSEYAGTGIGLAICKKIMGNHHGFISAQGEPNTGATFNLFLPC